MGLSSPSVSSWLLPVSVVCGEQLVLPWRAVFQQSRCIERSYSPATYSTSCDLLTTRQLRGCDSARILAYAAASALRKTFGSHKRCPPCLLKLALEKLLKSRSCCRLGHSKPTVMSLLARLEMSDGSSLLTWFFNIQDFQELLFTSALIGRMSK